jgi:nucleoside-diphosphate-sugar epimerase
VIFGPEDHFTTNLARLIRGAPGLLPIPGNGRTLVQPLWVEDLVTCLVWALQNPDAVNQTYDIGGGEYFTVRQVLETLMGVIRARRLIVSLPPPYMRALFVTLDAFTPGFERPHLPARLRARSSRKKWSALSLAFPGWRRSPMVRARNIART